MTEAEGLIERLRAADLRDGGLCDEAAAALQQAISERNEALAAIATPEAVRVNILRGTIKAPPDLVWLHDTNGPVAQRLTASLEDEREACALIANEYASVASVQADYEMGQGDDANSSTGAAIVAVKIAAAIRARKEKPS